MLAWFFTAVFIYILQNARRGNALVLIPLIELLWVNMHGSFIIGFPIYAVFIFAEMLINKRVNKLMIASFLATLLASFATPYGLNNWQETVTILTDSKLASNVSEWQSSIFVAHPLPILFFTLTFTLLVKYRKKIKTETVCLYLFFLALSAKSIRNVPVWVVAGLPILNEQLDAFGSTLKDHIAKTRFSKAQAKLFYIVLAVALFQLVIIFKSNRGFSENNYYPANAVDFLKAQNITTNIFSTYNWGGYLIWKYPEKKVYIDGRMASWRSSSAPANESGGAIDDYVKLNKDADFAKAQFAKYNITHVLWQKNTNNSKNSFLYSFLQEIKFVKPNKFALNEYLLQEGWQTIYEDAVALVLQKPSY